METNVILKYKRECDRWVCPECDNENDFNSPHCMVCGNSKPSSPAIVKAWSEMDEKEPVRKTSVNTSFTGAATYKVPPAKKIPEPKRGKVYTPASPKKKKSGAGIATVIITILIIAAIITGSILFVMNNDEIGSSESVDKNKEIYSEAMDEFDDGDYEKALELFEKLPSDYEDVSEMINKSKYQNALKLMEEEEFDKAKAIFDELKDYEDSADKSKECIYKKAQKLMNDGEYILAKELFDSISDYDNAENQSKYCYYNYAIELFNSGNYEDAENIFRELDGYEDSEEYLDKCVYAHADDCIDNNNFVEAMALLYEHTSGDTIDSKFVSAENALKSYNSSHGYFPDSESLVGTWKDSSGTTLKYYYNGDNITMESTMPWTQTPTYEFKNGIHSQLQSFSFEIQWAVQRVSNTSIKVFNYNNGKIYNFTKQ